MTKTNACLVNSSNYFYWRSFPITFKIFIFAKIQLRNHYQVNWKFIQNIQKLLLCGGRDTLTLYGLRKTFWGSTEKCENKNLTWFFLFVQDWDGNWRHRVVKDTKSETHLSIKFKFANLQHKCLIKCRVM